MCAPREKKQGSPAKAPGVDGGVGGLLQSSDAMTEAMSSTGLWRGGGVGGKKRMWLPAFAPAVPMRLPEPNPSKCCVVLCSAQAAWRAGWTLLRRGREAGEAILWLA